VGMPCPGAQATGGRSVARDAGKSAHFMRVGEALVCNLAIRGPFGRKVVGAAEFTVLRRAASVPALEPLALPLALHWIFADKAPRAVEMLVTAARAKGVVLVVGWLLELHAAPGIPAPLALYPVGGILDRRHFSLLFVNDFNAASPACRRRCCTAKHAKLESYAYFSRPRF